MITRKENLFCLHTAHTTYAFALLPTGHLEHLYYGRKITLDNYLPVQEKRGCELGNSICYDKADKSLTMENICLEVSSTGTGDIREPLVELIYEDGSRTSDFLFQAAVITSGKSRASTEVYLEGKLAGVLPGSYDASDVYAAADIAALPKQHKTDGIEASQREQPAPCAPGKSEGVEHLKITLQERYHPVTLELHYYVYPKCDVITRTSVLTNEGEAPIKVQRLMSVMLDFSDNGYQFSTFTGAWTREMNREDTVVNAGKMVNESVCGVSSNRANPFVMISRPETTEDYGSCYGMNLIYSGNHYEALQAGSWQKTRFVSGMHPLFTDATLRKDEVFPSPEGVMTFSAKGYNGMSQNMHRFIQEHIVRGSWKRRTRPVLLNSWEAAYFDFDERKLLKLAKAGAEAGVELFVMDDGWFGERNDDTSSLGDWTVNTKKLPHGLKWLADKINGMGMEFGIWVEPEMVNENSRCYREHPEWAIEIPNQHHAEGRNQKLLDLSNRQVQDYIIAAVENICSSANITYVKWDMNRIFSDCFSQKLSREQQGGLAHRYTLGLYRIMEVLTQKFPHILFEGCASGGNRFDLGILCYFPQIWASDNTDALSRSNIQYGYSYGYPLSVLSAHVSSSPNHQTLRNTPLSTRFHVAAFGIFGYECNLAELSREEFEKIKEQIALYKKWREVLQFGTFYRGAQGNLTSWNVVNEEQTKAVGMVMQKLVQPNSPFLQYQPKGLAEEKQYHFYNAPEKHNIKEFGDLINQAAPIHVKQDSLLHHTLAKFIKLDGETEDYQVYGDTLMYGGVKLKQGFAGSGFNENIRIFQDYASRMYFMEEI